jgi:hypothetical protein
MSVLNMLSAFLSLWRFAHGLQWAPCYILAVRAIPESPRKQFPGTDHSVCCLKCAGPFIDGEVNEWNGVVGPPSLRRPVARAG